MLSLIQVIKKMICSVFSIKFAKRASCASEALDFLEQFHSKQKNLIIKENFYSYEDWGQKHHILVLELFNAINFCDVTHLTFESFWGSSFLGLSAPKNALFL